MNFEIVTIAPVYYFLVCLAAALLFTWLLYRRQQFEDQRLVKVMAALRFLGLFVLFVLLLSPLFRLKRQVENKPELIIYTDNSISVDSATLAAADKSIQATLPELEKKFKVHRFYFSSGVQDDAKSPPDRNGTQTGSIFDFTNEYFEGANTAAVVVISDGIHNKGIHPLYKSFNKKVPLFAVGVGDTVLYPDVWLSEINANSTVFLDNEFSVSANLRAYGLKNKVVSIDLLQDGQRIQTQTRQIAENTFFGSVEFAVKPLSPGMKRFEVRVSAVAGENNLRNNAKSVFVRITDTRRKIAICYHAPHPDIGALARSLEQFGQYEIYRIPTAANLDPNAYDIYILHGFAANKQEQELVNQLGKSGKPTWLILSAQSQPQFSSFEETGLRLQFSAGNLTDAQGLVNAGFSEFVTEDGFVSGLRTWPPLKVPFGKYEMPKMFRPFLMQKIGAVETNFPLMGFTTSAGKRQAWLFGEGLWRWRMRDAEQNGNAEIFDDWVAKTIQYLTTDEVKEKFRVFAENTMSSPSENVVIYAEYLDQSLQLINKPNATLKVSGIDGFNKELPFARSGSRYRAELGALPVGDYTFTGKLATTPAQNYSGKFAVINSEPELENTRADHAMLRRLAARNNGGFYTLNTMEQLVQNLLNRKDIHTVISEESSVQEFIHVKWIFALLVLFFGAEWFLRKREGGY